MPSRESSSSERRQPGGLFRREGDYWAIAYAGQLVRLKDTKGLHYLAHLLQHPGRAFHVVELVAIAPRPRGSGGQQAARPDENRVGERTRKAVTNRIRQSIARIGAAHGTLGLHLGNAVHTGTRCAYTPEQPVRWSG